MPSVLNIFAGETLGTLILVLLGNGAIANVRFKTSMGSAGGLICIVFGWALGVFAGLMVANTFGTGGDINPAVTVVKMATMRIPLTEGFLYIIFQIIGAILGQIIINIAYWQHIKENDYKTVLGMHATYPTHEKKYFTNIWTEVIGTMLLLTMIFFAKPAINDVSANLITGANLFGSLTVALAVLAIGLSLGGPTGYAINPVRDLAPRLVFTVMYKAIPSLNSTNVSANWSYSWVPLISPLIAAGIISGLLYLK